MPLSIPPWERKVFCREITRIEITYTSSTRDTRRNKKWGNKRSQNRTHLRSAITIKMGGAAFSHSHSLLCQRIDTLLHAGYAFLAPRVTRRIVFLSHDICTLPFPSCTFYRALYHSIRFWYSSPGPPITLRSVFTTRYMHLLLDRRTLRILIILKYDCETSLHFARYTSVMPTLQYRKDFDIHENQIDHGKFSTNLLI